MIRYEISLEKGGVQDDYFSSGDLSLALNMYAAVLHRNVRNLRLDKITYEAVHRENVLSND